MLRDTRGVFPDHSLRAKPLKSDSSSSREEKECLNRRRSSSRSGSDPAVAPE